MKIPEKYRRRMKQLGLLVRKHRERAGLSRQELAYKSGLAIGTIECLELGHRENVYVSTLVYIGRVLGVTASELIEGLE